MKFKLFGLLFFCAALMVTSCKDDDPCADVSCTIGICTDGACVCTADEVTGTYTGTNDCDPTDVVDITLVVSGTGTSLSMVGDDGTSWDAALTGCETETFSQTIDFLGIMITIDIDLAFSEDAAALTISSLDLVTNLMDTCTVELVKQ